MKKRFSEEQIIGFLREADAGLPIKELCRQHGFSEASYYLWRSKFGGMDASLRFQLRELQDEAERSKKMYADAQLSTPSARSGACSAATAPQRKRQRIGARRVARLARRLSSTCTCTRHVHMPHAHARRLRVAHRPWRGSP